LRIRGRLRIRERFPVFKCASSKEAHQYTVQYNKNIQKYSKKTTYVFDVLPLQTKLPKISFKNSAADLTGTVIPVPYIMK
jgi:hypothetical protein